jgi:hypothetical protein
MWRFVRARSRTEGAGMRPSGGVQVARRGCIPSRSYFRREVSGRRVDRRVGLCSPIQANNPNKPNPPIKNQRISNQFPRAYSHLPTATTPPSSPQPQNQPPLQSPTSHLPLCPIRQVKFTPANCQVEVFQSQQ